MAVHGCISQICLDPDDSEPITFKRTNISSQGSDLKSPESHNSCQSSEKSFSQQSSPKGENTYSRRSKVCPAAKVLTEASDKHQDVLKNSQYGTEFSDDSDDDKPLSFRCSSVSAATKQIIYAPSKKSTEENHSDDDSDDDKPLSSRIVASTGREQKSNSSQMVHNSLSLSSNPQLNLKSNAQKNSSVKREEESSSKHSTKPGPVTSMKSHNSLGKKPLAHNIHLNGSSKRESNSVSTTNNASSKRPLGSTHGSVQSVNKKAKLSDSPAFENSVKKESFVKDEPETSSDDDGDDDDSDDDDDCIPLSKRIKKSETPNSQPSSKKVLKKVTSTPFKKKNRLTKKPEKNLKYSKPLKVPPGSGEGQKWTTLEHNGVIFPPPYKPHGVKMLYNGKEVDLTPKQEEVATMFAVMKDTEYAMKKTFIENFMNDWRVILGKNHAIKKFELCDFTSIYEWHLREKEKKKQMSTEEKKTLKEEKLQQEETFMWAIVDGVKEKIGNFRVEPPGLFRGRGEHPKMGKLKKRIYPHDITINIGKGAKIPQCPIPGERWKEIKHDNTVTWLAFWNDPINAKEFKYVFLAASSSLKGQVDKEKYEKARKLNDYICNIRANYTRDFANKDEMKRQIAVATYLIDKLALRAGNEKDDDEADTVGCCTLKVENVTLVPPNKLQFDFLGKDSIRYFNTVEVELPVYKAIGEFRKGGKKGGDDLFDKLDTSKLNAHLKELMPGLTAKVFRTYNASFTLDQMLNNKTKGATVLERIAVYQSANKEVAIICNHQRSVSKTHDAQMTRLDDKIAELKEQQEELKEDLSRVRRGKPLLKDKDGKPKRNLSTEALEKKLAQVDAKIDKIELDKKIKEDLKTVALGTSKINYLDPRISVAWCKRNEVPIEKIFNKSLLAKFSWAMDADPTFRF